MIAIPFWKVLLGFETFGLRDYGLFSYPVAFFHRQCFWRGELPVWNSYDLCGVPFLAQFNTLVLYPLSLIYLLLPLPWSLSFFCLVHLFLGGMGMYFLAARWSGCRAGGAVAGVAFAFNGLTLNFMMWPSHLATFAWMPWVMLLTEAGWEKGGRTMVMAALAGAMEVLAGGPETILLTWLLLGTLAGVRAVRTPGAFWVTTRRFLCMGLVTLALSSPLWLPFADLARHANRGTHFGTSEWSMPPWGWGNFIVPMFQTSQWQQIAVQRAQYWTSSYYGGIGVLFLALTGLWRRREGRVWWLGGCLLASIILALGDNGMVFMWLKRLAPFLGMFRYPVKFVILTVAVMPLLAAYGLAQYESWKARGLAAWRPEMALGAVLVGLAAIIIVVARLWPVEGASWTATARNGFWRAVFLGLTILAVVFFATRPGSRGWGILLVLGVCWCDVLTHAPWQNPTLDPSVYYPQINVRMDPQPALGRSRLMMSPYAAHLLTYKPATDLKTNYVLDRIVFLADCNLLDGLPKVDGFFSLTPQVSDRVLRLLEAARSRQQLDNLEDLLSVSETIAPGKVFDWVPRTNYIPIVSIGQEPVFTNDEGAFEAIADIRSDFRKVVYMPLDGRSSITARRQPDARIVSEDFGNARRRLEVVTPGPALVVVGEAFYHDWHARVDGTAVALWRANYAFQAVEVPAGRHEVTLVYKDEALRIGWILGALGLIGCVAGFAAWRNPGPERPGEAQAADG
jgi:hypothetical protein